MSRKRLQFAGETDAEGTSDVHQDSQHSRSHGRPSSSFLESQQSTGHESLLEYVNSHNILCLFEDMIGHLLREKPDRPLHFLSTRMAELMLTSRNRHRKSLFGMKQASLRDSFMELEAAGGAEGTDPIAPPGGVYGGYGKTSHRRSVAEGLGSGWGALVSDSEDEDGDEDESVASTAAKTPRVETPMSAALRLRDEVKEELERCQEGSTECSLYDLRLKVVPTETLQLTHVTLLDLSNNSLAELPPAIGDLGALTTLCLRSNCLTVLPAALGKLRLETLQLEQNMLLELPAELAAMDTLRYIGLDWNDLLEFPDCLCSIKALAEISIIENPDVTTLPLERMKGFEKLLLCIDNYPTVVEQWTAEGASALANVTVDYNKVFPDKVLPGLFLGTLRSAQSERIYRTLNITYVCSVGRELRTCQAAGVTNLKLNVDDLPGTDITECFEQVHATIDRAVAENNACLVHCFKGQSRSASCVISYIIRKMRMGAEEAEAFVKERSPRICPNPGFRAKLADYAATVLARPVEHQ
eukprot:TRINITY_DN10203_c4_g1_i1.p1 TRINITY_DN10203_c4_g1~~TRINITY_DN10203_c4_g1_i1.p1  ORF type:complete len:527 (+),score=180.03 TRINITY_DN10203_c4_g1_i1:104-1684(+)